MGDSSGDVKCTDDNDRNNNVVTYYTNKSELYSALLYKASLHSGVRERERKRVLEGYFQRPLDQVDPKLYKDLRIVETRRSLSGIVTVKRNHYFHDYYHYFHDS